MMISLYRLYACIWDNLPVLATQVVNEHWLFHGTTAEAAKGIAENDFRRLSRIQSN